MSTKKRGLGRGLESLLGAAPAPVRAASKAPAGEGPLGEAPVAANPALKEAAGVEGAVLRALPIEQLERGAFQPRQHFDEEALEELAASIRSQGLMQPLVVRPLDDQRFEIIAGERRWRAAQRAGLDRVPALVRSLDDQSALALALIENVQREDLSPLEEAAALERLMTPFPSPRARPRRPWVSSGRRSPTSFACFAWAARRDASSSAAISPWGTLGPSSPWMTPSRAPSPGRLFNGAGPFGRWSARCSGRWRRQSKELRKPRRRPGKRAI